jgi:hypothetical protein
MYISQRLFLFFGIDEEKEFLKWEFWWVEIGS